jgi:hypothetical protein
MDEPLPSHHRTASAGGLTSPDPVTAAHGPRPPRRRRPRPRKHPDKPHNCERPDNHAAATILTISSRGPAAGKRSPEFTRWIEAKRLFRGAVCGPLLKRLWARFVQVSGLQSPDAPGRKLLRSQCVPSPQAPSRLAGQHDGAAHRWPGMTAVIVAAVSAARPGQGGVPGSRTLGDGSNGQLRRPPSISPTRGAWSSPVSRSGGARLSSISACRRVRPRMGGGRCPGRGC